jgi:hypothetical protein
MREILGNEYKLNQIVCVGYLNDRGNYEILSGRIFDYDSTYIWLDHSYDYWQLEDTTRIKMNDIKYIKVTVDCMWR